MRKEYDFSESKPNPYARKLIGYAMKVRFCDNNKGKGKVLRRLEEEHPDIDATVEKCLGICGPCAEQPVALVDGKKVTGKDGDDLYRRIVAASAEEHKVERKRGGRR